MNTITSRQQEVLTAVARGKSDVPGLAKHLGVAHATVRGTLRTLRENGLIEGISGDLAVTSDGQPFVSATRGNTLPEGEHRKGTTIQKAKEIFERHFDRAGRQGVLKMFVDKLNMTTAGASTYFQNLRHETGVAYQNARGTAAGNGRSARGGKTSNRPTAGGNSNRPR